MDAGLGFNNLALLDVTTDLLKHGPAPQEPDRGRQDEFERIHCF